MAFAMWPVGMSQECAAGRARNRLVDGLSAPSHYAAAFSSPSRTFAGRVSFHTAAASSVIASTVRQAQGRSRTPASGDAMSARRRYKPKSLSDIRAYAKLNQMTKCLNWQQRWSDRITTILAWPRRRRGQLCDEPIVPAASSRRGT